MIGLETRLRCRKMGSATRPGGRSKGFWKMICLPFPYLFVRAWQKKQMLRLVGFFFLGSISNFLRVLFFCLPVYLSVSGWASCILDFYHHGLWVNWAF